MEDNICAISTSGGGAISIIRVSGKDAVLMVDKIFDKNIIDSKSHIIKYGHIIHNNEIIDEVLLMIMRGPKTYTREDIVEINCHGGYSVSLKILDILLANGCRIAEPGEFTKRAFLNGRIDLTMAEAVNDLINAKTENSRKLAINAVRGKLNQKINELREKISKILANIEVNIDYPEYIDEVEVTNELIEQYLNEISQKLNEIIEDSQNGQIIKHGINVAIIGRPNVGKSSLLNTLIDEEKAIVTNIPGTTRDIVEGTITLNGVLINFIDTAGIRDTDDIVEKMGVSKSEEVSNKADLIILVFSNDEELTAEDKKLMEKNKLNKTIYFVNKNDLAKKINIDKEAVYGNTKTIDGIKHLKKAIIQKMQLNLIENKDLTYLSNSRQIALMQKAKDAIDNALVGKNNHLPIDLIEIDIKNAWQFLGEITGEFYEDELVDKIFSNFCLGK